MNSDLVYSYGIREPRDCEPKKIACFDFDQTLVHSKKNPLNISYASPDDWEWHRSSVPVILRKLYDKGYMLYIFSNQSKALKVELIHNVVKNLGLPIKVIIGFKGRTPQKPDPGLFKLAKIGTFDSSLSFFCGDASGVEGTWSSSDADFAKNIGLKFIVPEKIFPIDERVAFKNEHLLVESQRQEMIILIGSPASGKSTLTKKYFPNYVHLENDILKTPTKMLNAARRELMAGKSIVIDATNPTMEKRDIYLKLAKSLKVATKAIYIKSVLIDKAIEYDRGRALKTGKHIPKVAFYTYRKRLEEPNENEFEDLIIL
jgi:bifunctional polynucleotide phosphatase/kinase